MQIKGTFYFVVFLEINESDLVPKVNEHGEVKDMDLIVNSMRVGSFAVKAGIIPDPRKNFPKIRDMKTFDDDILICAYQKAGTHWLWEIASMLNKGSSEYERKTKESVMLEFNDPDQFDNLARPRVLNTHLIFEALPKGILEKRCRVLYIQRNPKDMTVSCYNHMKGMRPPEAPKMVWDDYCYFSLTGQEPFVPWYKHREGFEQELDDRQDHILPLFYEDIKKDPVEEIKKIASFLKVECSDTFAKEVAEKCNFKNLKEADKKKEQITDRDFNFLYRKDSFTSWYLHMKGYEEVLDERSDHILSLFYEDLKKDAVAEIKKIAAFLKTECSDTFAEEIAERCNFKNLKEADKKKKNDYKADLNFLYRKGEVGDWKNWFTVAQNERMDAFIAEKTKGSRFKYQYVI
ncbi:hypothetical protein FSP39_003174 [Pinctada imbricata]|uniref:Sulfotransferase domain-containing protein n=1 Tax=Pinctada imbricata TaxID=66713 RepID=A0AA89C9S4_PINIB|nr:hypothetical protein FSP39_003174 [Pinctada imbricata]